MAAITLWLCTGATLNHTDDPKAYGVVASSANAPAALHQTPIASTDDEDCAACRWAQAARQLSGVQISIRLSDFSYSAFTQLLPCVVPTPAQRLASLRAPPAPLA